jgi:hypothetical protein
MSRTRARTKEANQKAAVQPDSEMRRNDKVNPKLLAEVTAAIEKANTRNRGAFDGLFGSLPEGASPLIDELMSYLRRYLLDERGFSEKRVRRLCAAATPPLKETGKVFRPISRDLDDEGARVAVGILNSVAAAMRLTDKQAIRLLLSGKDGVRGAKVREGGGHRAADTKDELRQRISDMQKMIDEAARKYPDSSYRQLAKHVGVTLGCDERTVRRNIQNPRKKRSRDTTS